MMKLICGISNIKIVSARKTATKICTQSSSSFVIIQENKTKIILDNLNPFIYSNIIKKTIPDDIPSGHDCIVQDSHGKVIARGVYNSGSLYRVRILALASDTQPGLIDPFNISFSDFLLFRLKQAKLLRELMFSNDNFTSVYRLVNGEGDKLSGLVVDVFNDDVLVVQSSAAWSELHRPLIESNLRLLYPYSSSLVWTPMLSRLSQENWVTPVKSSEGQIIDDNISRPINPIKVYENGIIYEVYPGVGQKTGFYCDQRENRLLLQKFSRGKDVLDLFSGSGGFTLNALVGGAKRVVAVDSSEEAINSLLSNLAHNDVRIASGDGSTNMLFVRSDSYAEENISSARSIATATVVKADVNKFLQLLHEKNTKYSNSTNNDSSSSSSGSHCLDLFDIVICDPPKLAPKKTFLNKAMKRYIKINSAAMKLLRPGGLLLTCSCSTVVAQEPGCFTQILREAGVSAGRDVTVLLSASAGPDHPQHIGYMDGKHLSVVLARVA